MKTEDILAVVESGAGMNEKIKAELDRIVATLAWTGIVTRVIHFGSYARARRPRGTVVFLRGHRGGADSRKFHERKGGLGLL